MAEHTIYYGPLFELSLQVALGGPLIATKGFGSSEVETAYQRAPELSRDLQSESDLFSALRGLAGQGCALLD